ncbi:MAG: AMP-binding protein [Bacteroidales bacterium]|nr:AMP-binding protein [Bacteroidales bacterium]
MKILQSRTSLALSYKDQNFTYNDLVDKVASYNELLKPFIPKKVMIYSENRPEWIFAFYGALSQQAIVVPADVMSTAPELNYMIADCRPDVVFCSAAKKDVLKTALQSITGPPHIFIFEDLTNLEKPLINPELEITDFQKTALIIYTSGTTGSQKGVMLSYENLIFNIRAVSEDIPIYKDTETTMILLPLHHIFPLLGSMMAPLMVGGKTAMSPTLTTDDILKTLQEHKVTIIIGVPRLYALIRKGVMDKVRASKAGRVMFSLAGKLNSRSFSKKVFKAVHQKFGGHVKYMVCGGAPLDPEVAMDYKTLGFEMLEGYGMTEAAPMISFTRPGKWKIGAAGQIMPRMKVEIRDGEITAFGKNIMQGYYNKPEDTAAILKDGWLYTGDLGEVDSQGFIKITGRKKEIIVTSSGKNINPAELEQAIEEKINGVAEIGVLLHNDKLHALIVADHVKLQAAGVTDLKQYFRDELINHFNKDVAPYKKIISFTIVTSELPRTRLGKLQRFKLHQLLEAVSKGTERKSTPEFEEYTIIKTYLEEQKAVEVFPDDHLEFDLGLDSLDKVGLQTWLEKSFGVDLKVENLMSFPSVMKLAEHIREKKSKFQLETINWSDILKEKVHIRFPGSWYFSQLMIKFSKYVYKVYFRLSCNGLQNIPKEPCIIAPNHQSFFDGFIIASLLKRKTFSKTYFYAKEKHIRPRWLKFLAHHNNIIIVDLNNDLRLSIQKMAMALQNNRNIIIFPEGTRTKDGTIGQFKDTFAILSRELGVPVIPVAIDGAWHAFPSGSIFPRPFRQITVSFLEPIHPGNESYQALSQVVRSKIQDRLAS